MLPHLRLAVQEQNRREIFRDFHLSRRLMRSTADPFALVDTHFIQLFRLNKGMVNFFIDEIGPHMSNSAHYSAVNPITRIFTAIAFYASGTYQRVIGQSFNLSVSQETASRAIHEITGLINEHLSDRFIIFPQNNVDKARIKEMFMEKTRFPGVIGAVDCTHVAIIRPQNEEHNYLNRKGFHSKNIQLICDYDLNILNINARYPGSCHDAFIWRNSIIIDELVHCHKQGDVNTWILGDSGYPQEPWLLTPVPNAAEGSPQQRYNNAHCSARNCVERCNGVLKGRFRCLLGERTLRYSPDFVGDIAVACTVLHNMCIRAHLEGEYVQNLDEDVNMLAIQDGDRRDDSRNSLIERYFA